MSFVDYEESLHPRDLHGRWRFKGGSSESAATGRYGNYKGQKFLRPSVDDGAGELTTQERDAVDVYTDELGNDINRELRDGSVSRSTRTLITQIDHVMKRARLTEDTVLYRGYSTSSEFGAMLEEIEPGGRITDKGFASTSLVKLEGWRYGVEEADQGYMRINAPKGTSAIVTGAHDLMGGPVMQEVILNRDTTLVFRGVGEDGVAEFDVEQVGLAAKAKTPITIEHFKMNPKVLKVAKGRWNIATAKRLEKEYEAVKPELEAIVKNLVSAKKGRVKAFPDMDAVNDDYKMYDRLRKTFLNDPYNKAKIIKKYGKISKAQMRDRIDSLCYEMSDKALFQYGIDKGLYVQGSTVGNREHKKPKSWDPINKPSKEARILARDMVLVRAEQLCRERRITGSFDLEQMNDDLWSGWVDASDSREGKDIQIAAAAELGTRINHKRTGRKKIIGSNEVQEATKALMRANWEVSQYFLDKAGKQNLILYRAIELSGKVVEDRAMGELMPNVEIKRNGALSTSANRTIANNWGFEPCVMRIDTPRTSVLSLPLYGNNYHHEQEVILVGGPWNDWQLYYGKAP